MIRLSLEELFWRWCAMTRGDECIWFRTVCEGPEGFSGEFAGSLC